MDGFSMEHAASKNNRPDTSRMTNALPLNSACVYTNEKQHHQRNLNEQSLLDRVKAALACEI